MIFPDTHEGAEASLCHLITNGRRVLSVPGPEARGLVRSWTSGLNPTKLHCTPSASLCKYFLLSFLFLCNLADFLFFGSCTEDAF
jgi:hypothetical protein